MRNSFSHLSEASLALAQKKVIIAAVS